MRARRLEKWAVHVSAVQQSGVALLGRLIVARRRVCGNKKAPSRMEAISSAVSVAAAARGRGVNRQD